MTVDDQTTLQRVAPGVVAVIAEDLRVLHDRSSEGEPGGGDVDCAVRGTRPFWPLRLGEWRVCQALRYDATATYYVLVRGDETLAIDVLDDPRGVGKYGFATAVLGDGAPGGKASTSDRAAYLTVKRIVKNESSESSWTAIRAMVAVDPAAYRSRLSQAVGHRLAVQISDSISAELPQLHQVKVWNRAYQVRRLLRPWRTTVRAWLGITRLAYRLRYPTGFVIAVVGPDGAGKSAIADALPTECGQLFRRHSRTHFRPGLLPRPGALLRRPETSNASQPHSREAHGRAMSFALVLYYWLDAVLGHATKVVPARLRTSLVIVERGFLDISVDPLRYRLNVAPRVVRALARLVPRPDLTILLDSPAEVVAARKPELAPAEITRQRDAWRTAIRDRDSVEVDSSKPFGETLADVRTQIVLRLERRALARCEGGWAAIPSTTNTRFSIPRRPRTVAVAGFRLVSPNKARSRAILGLARTGASIGGARLLRARALPPDVARLIAPYVPENSTVALKHAVHAGRYSALVVNALGEPGPILKVATDDLGRARLRAERTAIERRAPLLRAPLVAPKILAADEHVLAFEWAPHQPRRRPWILPLEVAHGLGVFFAAGMIDRDLALSGPAHGDAAPWNLLRCGREWMLIDWEVSMDDAPPFFDVYHYLVQAHALLGRPGRKELLRGVAGTGWIGEVIAAYAYGAGLWPSLAGPSFERYLEHTSSAPTRRDMGDDAVRLRHDLRKAMEA